jgi:hypothetical protein
MFYVILIRLTMVKNGRNVAKYRYIAFKVLCSIWLKNADLEKQQVDNNEKKIGKFS